MPKILIIEDNQTVQASIQDLLEGEGFQTLCASDGHQGVQLAQKNSPDLIICDVQMPTLSGYDVLTTLQENPETATIPFIFLTGKGTKRDLRHGMELGADDYLIKPFTAKELLKAIARRLEKQTIIHTQSQQQLDHLRKSIALSLPHELQSPITSILVNVEILRTMAEMASPSEIVDIAHNIQSSTERLYRLVQNFLLYAELEVAKHDPEHRMNLLLGETYSPAQIVEEVASHLALEAKRETDLHLNLQDSGILFPTAKFKQIVEELVGNAFKFSTAGTSVTVTSCVQPNYLMLQVTDYGRGMTPGQIARLGAYMQFDRSFHEQQGAGLGLHIVKQLVELSGGEFKLESQLGQHTTVSVSFPISHSSDVSCLEGVHQWQ